ncbi:MAG TPA: hypothetical protein VE987_13965 [Polyangiaceae bacterium]|nr:hypothetical protein [Polyangiaceae bacterium]
MDPDAELARALDVALSPWGATVTEVHVDHPGATVSLPVEQARVIAGATNADVVMWVSGNDGHYSVWIYDVASNQASLRELDSAPPFDATRAAAVALSVKALLRFTVVAPPPERFGATQRLSAWVFGLNASIATHLGADVTADPRSELYAGFWPARFAYRLGLSLGVSYGLGVALDTQQPFTDMTTMKRETLDFHGTLTEFVARLALGARLPVRRDMELEPSLAGAFHLFSLSYTSLPIEAKAGAAKTAVHYTPALEPRLALRIALLDGIVHIAPWIGATFLMRQHDFIDTTTGIQVGQAPLFTAEAGIRAEFSP